MKSTLTHFHTTLFILISIFLTGCSMHDQFEYKLNKEYSRQPLTDAVLLTNVDIAGLPSPVQQYLRFTGSVGKARPQNVQVEFDAQMFRKPGAAPMDAVSEQVNFFRIPARIFYMKASQYLIPFRVLHTYQDGAATMVVRVASLFNAVDLSGKELTEAETVTLLNDICIFAPGALVDDRITWKEIDPHTVECRFTNGAYSVSARLIFDQEGALVNFVSDDRGALQDDGTLRKVPWSTPISEYKEFDGRRVPTYGETIYHYPEGPFTYGIFRLKSIRYNVSEAVQN
jgi:hypothetical protein